MRPYVHKPLLTSVCVSSLIAFIACTDSTGPTMPGPQHPGSTINSSFQIPSDIDPDRHMIGLWRWDLEAGISEPVSARTLADHTNVADALLMPEYADALEIGLDAFWSSGVFAPPAVKVTVTLNNIFDLDGWNVRGIVIDDSGLIRMQDPDGYTHMWDLGNEIPLNPYLNFSLPDGSFPISESITREYVIESPTGQIPGFWFAVDVGTNGLIKSATEFPVASVNGVLRFPGDQAPMRCEIIDPWTAITWLAAGTKKFAGSATHLYGTYSDGSFRVWEGTLNYIGGLSEGGHSLYFGAHSPLDIPTLASTTVYVDSGPFATGPASTGCPQRCYDPARTCRTNVIVAKPLNDFVIRPPASASGLVLTEDNKIVRRLENDRSIAFQTPGLDYPYWTRLIGESELATVPAIGDDGTIFFLEPEQGRLRALWPDGSDRWVHQFQNETHTDLVLTSSPLGGLLITILREDNKDVAIVGVGTDGHERWRFNFPEPLSGLIYIPRLAVGPLGTLYYTIPGGGVYAFDLYGNLKWDYVQPYLSTSSDPVVGDDDRVFFIASNGQLVVCLTADGFEKWTYHVPEFDRFARFPSLSHVGDLYIIIEHEEDYVAYRQIDGESGVFVTAVQAIGARGYLVHAANSDLIYVQREDPAGQTTCCDDFFACRSSDGTLQWSINTPGVTQIGAYPVIDPNAAVYVQGPDGMYVVMY